jgi:hypothetical protein
MVHLRAGSRRSRRSRQANAFASTDILSALAKALNVTLEEVIARETE